MLHGVRKNKKKLTFRGPSGPYLAEIESGYYYLHTRLSPRVAGVEEGAWKLRKG